MLVKKTNLLTSKRRVIYRGIRGGFFIRKAGGLKRYGIKAAFRVINGRNVPIRIVTKTIPKKLVSHRIAEINRTRPMVPVVERRPVFVNKPVERRPVFVNKPVERGPVFVNKPVERSPVFINKPVIVKRPMPVTVDIERMDAPKSIIVTHDTIPKNRESRISLMANSLVREKQKL